MERRLTRMMMFVDTFLLVYGSLLWANCEATVILTTTPQSDQPTQAAKTGNFGSEETTQVPSTGTSAGEHATQAANTGNLGSQQTTPVPVTGNLGSQQTTQAARTDDEGSELQTKNPPQTGQYTKAGGDTNTAHDENTAQDTNTESDTNTTHDTNATQDINTTRDTNTGSEDPPTATFLDHWTVSPDDLTKCLQANGEINIFAREGTITFRDFPAYTDDDQTTTSFPGFHDNESNSTFDTSQAAHRCVLNVTVPPKHILQLTVLDYLNPCHESDFLFAYAAGIHEYLGMLGPMHLTYTHSVDSDGGSLCEESVDVPPVIISDTNWSKLKIEVRPNDSHRQMLVARFTATEKPELEVHYQSPYQGYVQTPGWDGTAQYPRQMDSTVVIEVPEGHVTMVSFKRFHVEMGDDGCDYDSLEVYAFPDRLDSDKHWNLCGSSAPEPTIFNARWLEVVFTSDHDVQFSGFRMLFSFHQMTEMPVYLLDANLWNCSTPHWADFQQHLLCNLEKECVGGEDEKDCPYTSDKCKQGQITVGDRCYVRVVPSDHVTWRQAFDICLMRGGRLASLNTPTEWNDVIHLLQKHGRLSHGYYVGLKTAGPDLPRAYRDFWVWADGTVAYYNAITGDKSIPTCSLLALSNDKLNHMHMETQMCDLRVPADVLCEFDLPQNPQDPEGRRLHFPEVTWPFSNDESGHSVTSDHVVCPGGHVTHTFLACDAKTVCWEEKESAEGTDRSCDAPLASLPPTYACADGLERVPYTFVCDHREHCRDGSDESFCTFRQCILGQFPCGTQCASLEDRCDGKDNCIDGTDEQDCYRYGTEDISSPLPPAVVCLNGHGGYYFCPQQDFEEMDENTLYSGHGESGRHTRSVQHQFTDFQSVQHHAKRMTRTRTKYKNSKSVQQHSESISRSRNQHKNSKSERHRGESVVPDKTFKLEEYRENRIYESLIRQDNDSSVRQTKSSAPSLKQDHSSRSNLHQVLADKTSSQTMAQAHALKSGLNERSSWNIGDTAMTRSLSSKLHPNRKAGSNSHSPQSCRHPRSIPENDMAPLSRTQGERASGENHADTFLPHHTGSVAASRVSRSPEEGAIETGFHCPETHFQCPGEGYCLPVFVRCNEVFDCPGREDEAECDSYTCPGHYRCRNSRICVHADNMCDGIGQCPEHDDELLCHLACPDSCICFGWAFVCTRPIFAALFADLRYLDASGTGMTPRDLALNRLLIHLALSRCQLETIEPMHLYNLRSLDLSHNLLTAISSSVFVNTPSLQSLSLAGNPLVRVFGDGIAWPQQLLPSVTELDLSGVAMEQFNVSDLAVLSGLQRLNLSHTGLDQLSQEGFQPLSTLQVLDTRGCGMSVFPQNVFRGMTALREIYADNYRLCCPDALPSGARSLACTAPSDEISSCEALLRSNIYRVFVYIFSAMAIFGNMFCILYRVTCHKSVADSGFSIMVTHLHVSDLLMGVYLAIIAVADRMYQGVYLWFHLQWRYSAACSVAGFLSFLSSEVSAFLICLVTLDRFLVLRFPFSRCRFRKKSSQVVCVLIWLAGVSLASVPLVFTEWEFYSQNSICIPLPVTRGQFPGRAYAFSIVIVLNFILFVLIAVGQAFVFYAMKTSSLSGPSAGRKSQDLVIAQRLVAIVLSDFLCWFPVGLLGLLASRGVPIPGEVNVGLAALVLPFNSAINPFLYTFNIAMERRERKKRRRSPSKLASTVSLPSVMNTHFSSAEALSIVKKLLADGSLSVGTITSLSDRKNLNGTFSTRRKDGGVPCFQEKETCLFQSLEGRTALAQDDEEVTVRSKRRVSRTQEISTISTIVLEDETMTNCSLARRAEVVNSAHSGPH